MDSAAENESERIIITCGCKDLWVSVSCWYEEIHPHSAFFFSYGLWFLRYTTPFCADRYCYLFKKLIVIHETTGYCNQRFSVVSYQIATIITAEIGCLHILQMVLGWLAISCGIIVMKRRAEASHDKCALWRRDALMCTSRGILRTKEQ